MKYFLLVLLLTVFSCSSQDNRKEEIERLIENNQAKDARFREITGYSEMDDSLGLKIDYPQPELIDSIWYLKKEKEMLIDSLQKLQ